MKASVIKFGALLLVAMLSVYCGKKEETYNVSADITPLIGEWEGAIHIKDIELGMVVKIFNVGDSMVIKMDIPEQGAHELPIENISWDGEKIHFELNSPAGRAYYDGVLEGDRMEGTFKQGLNKGTFNLTLIPEEVLPYPTEEIEIKVSDELTLAGTLSMPEGTGPFPAVILVTGSGPQNRDEAIFGFKPFKLIADHLTRAGIAVLRCDDRGIGKSVYTGDTENMTTEDFAGDCQAQFEYLLSRPEINPAKIGILGHSEGGLVAVMVAAENPEAAFIIMMAGPAVDGDAILVSQVEAAARLEGQSEEEIARAVDIQKRTNTAVRSGKGLDPVVEDLRELMTEQTRALPIGQKLALGGVRKHVDKQIESSRRQVESAWFHFFIVTDPAEYLTTLSCPVLALYGGKDFQVVSDLNTQALDEIISSKEKSNITYKVFDDANHLFQDAETGSFDEYKELKKEFIPGFLETIEEWILTDAL